MWAWTAVELLAHRMLYTEGRKLSRLALQNPSAPGEQRKQVNLGAMVEVVFLTAYQSS